MSDGIIRVERTGDTWGIASSEFRVTWPDGTTETVWSSVWHNWDRRHESKHAYKWAVREWQRRQENA
jgi:hypothetical protein